MSPTAALAGHVIGERYRLEQPVGGGEPDGQGLLWRGSDLLASDAPVALRQLGPGADQDGARARWVRLQGVLHPQVPRFGAVIAEDDQLWLVRDWLAGRTFAELLEARRERQMVFGAGEVLLLLRQLLPALAVVHGQDLLHGDLCPANLLRRDSDGLPTLLDFGLVSGLRLTTPGYAPPELAQGSDPKPWMDLHALGVVALVLLSGDEPATLLDPDSLEWRWPAALEDEPALAQQLRRLLSRDAGDRFAGASAALAAFKALEMPDSTGPVPRADRTVILVPPDAPPLTDAARAAAEPAVAETAIAESAQPQPAQQQPSAGPTLPLQRPSPPPPPAPLPPPVALPRRRALEKEEAAEGGLWPVVLALGLSAVVGTALGWWWLGRGQAPQAKPDEATELPSSLPAVEINQRQQLLSRLRALQVDRGWFVKLVDASLLAQYPERSGRLPSDAGEDAPLRRVWNELAEDWLARVEQLPLSVRRRLGGYTSGDWSRSQTALVNQGLSPSVLDSLVSSSARSLLPGRSGDGMPPEPFRQLWYAAAELTLENVRIEPIQVLGPSSQVVSAQVGANGARLFPIRLPPGYQLVLGVNGTPLLQMTVFDAEGGVLEASGPLRVVSLGPQQRSPVQLLVTNNGVAPAGITLSLRADPPPPPSPTEPPGDEVPPQPPAEPDAAPAEPEGAATPGEAPSVPASPQTP